MDISKSESCNRKPLKDQKSCPPTYSKKNVLIKEMHMNILFKSSNGYKTLKNTIQMNNLLRIMTSIHIYEVIKCSFSNPEKKKWVVGRILRKEKVTTHGPGGKLAAESPCGVRNSSVKMLSLVPGCVISCTLVAQLISMILISAPTPSPSPGS